MVDTLPLLVLYRAYTNKLSYYDDWADAFCRHQGFYAKLVNIDKIKHHHDALRDIINFPYVVLLHSTNADGVAPLKTIMSALRDRRGKLAVFVGNEVNLPNAPMSEKLSVLKQVEPDLILTQLIEEAGKWYYSPIRGARVACITHALNPMAYRPGPALRQRRIEIGARSHRYSAHIGDVDRNRLHDRVVEAAGKLGMHTDIEIGGRRFDRSRWAEFLRACRATVSTEAGSAFLDRDDELVNRVESELEQRRIKKSGVRSVLKPRQLARRAIPLRVRYSIQGFAENFGIDLQSIGSRTEGGEEITIEIQKLVFHAKNAAPKYTKVISSRHFDAIGTKTVQILLGGRYNDILREDEHYIRADISMDSIEDALLQLRDLSHCQRIVDGAYEFAMSSHTYAHRMMELETELRELG